MVLWLRRYWFSQNIALTFWTQSPVIQLFDNPNALCMQCACRVTCPIMRCCRQVCENEGSGVGSLPTATTSKQTSHTHLSHYPTQNPLSYLSILYSPDALFKWVSQSLFWAALCLCMQKRGHWMWEDCNHAFKFFSVCVFLTHTYTRAHAHTHAHTHSHTQMVLHRQQLPVVPQINTI